MKIQKRMALKLIFIIVLFFVFSINIVKSANKELIEACPVWNSDVDTWKCYADIAVKQKDIGVCNSGFKGWCLKKNLEYTEMNSDSRLICDGEGIGKDIRDNSFDAALYDCYRRVAYKTQDYAMCLAMPSENGKNACIGGVTSVKKVRNIVYAISIFILIILLLNIFWNKLFEKLNIYLLFISLLLYSALLYLKFSIITYDFYFYSKRTFLFIVTAPFVFFYILKMKQYFIQWKNNDIVEKKIITKLFLYAASIVLLYAIFDELIFQNYPDISRVIWFWFVGYLEFFLFFAAISAVFAIIAVRYKNYHPREYYIKIWKSVLIFALIAVSPYIFMFLLKNTVYLFIR